MPTEYCIYLRKSRADLEAEARGSGETLARHEHVLLDLAKERSLPIGAIYKELVSGERISNRPVVQQLLAEVEAGRWAGVLVMEVTRLARGDTIDQGLVAQAFKYSKTFIITPQKDYDPSNEMDEEWFEIGLFFSRQEYRMIRRRQLAGMQAARREGRYIGNRCPYGYERYKLDTRGWSLRPVPEQAKVVQMIYDLYLSGLGYSRIAARLNDLHIPSAKGGEWAANTIPGILRNPHYAGYIPSGSRPAKKQVEDGQLTIHRPRSHACELYEGLHEPIIGRADWEQVQRRMNRNATPRANKLYPLANPLSGLIICDCCGSRMQRRAASSRLSQPVILCGKRGCETVSHNAEEVEHLLLQSLRQYLDGLALDASHAAAPDLTEEQQALAAIEKQLADLDSRIRRTFELVEDGTYTKAVFLARQAELSDERVQLAAARVEIETHIAAIKHEYESRAEIAPHFRHVLDAYDFTASAEERNNLLKQVISRVDYHKRTRTRWSAECDLTLTIHPKIISYKTH